MAYLQGQKYALATMHKKEQVIAPILNCEFGLEVVVPENFNSDLFGTFTKEVERTGDQLEAARKKAEQAMKQTGLKLAVSSEGSFGPHPSFPYLAYNRELVLFIDQDEDLEITGYVANSETNFARKEVTSFDEAFDFGLSVGFPEHGLIVSAGDKLEVYKGITTEKQLREAVKLSKKVWVETDMRAMFNPTRMKNIELATLDLVKKLNSLCPKCDARGFEVVESKKGLPCCSCRLPTGLILSHLYECKKCQHKEELFYPNGQKQADPAFCQMCNP